MQIESLFAFYSDFLEPVGQPKSFFVAFYKIGHLTGDGVVHLWLAGSIFFPFGYRESVETTDATKKYIVFGDFFAFFGTIVPIFGPSGITDGLAEPNLLAAQVSEHLIYLLGLLTVEYPHPKWRIFLLEGDDLDFIESIVELTGKLKELDDVVVHITVVGLFNDFLEFFTVLS